MPTITVNGVQCEFTPGQTILQIAKANGVDVPHYCYHDGLSIPANCRICLGEVWAPNPRNDNKLEPMAGGKLMPTCHTTANDGMVVYTDSPKAVANQKAVMEYLLINHPLDCPVCDQAGECWLQDYSYKYGRGVSRFEETKVKNPKKDLGPNVYLYADRCIMCTRCVRFTREVSGTSELYVDGRGNREEIDVFPSIPLDNEMAANVIDLCPVGALLDKDFLFAQRVWFLKTTPSIDGITASGDNINIEHNEGKIYRVKPRTNLDINKWWISDEVRYGWKHVHAEHRLRSPLRRQHGALIEDDWNRSYDQAIEGLRAAAEAGKRIALLVSPMLTCEDAYALATMARTIDPDAILGVGPIRFEGEDKTFPPGVEDDDPKAFKIYAEKAPNARGVRRILEAITGESAIEYDQWLDRSNRDDVGAVIITGNDRQDWAPQPLLERANRATGSFVVVIDTLASPLIDGADVVLPSATWTEKAGTFENARNMLQAFEQAVPVIEFAKSEGQIAYDMLAVAEGVEAGSAKLAEVVVVDEGPGQVPTAAEVLLPRARLFNAADARREMAAAYPTLDCMQADVRYPAVEAKQHPDMEVVEL
ncbi:MAG: molybdopterin-dependent oxidoreductase [Planctomycetota bacterium]